VRVRLVQQQYESNSLANTAESDNFSDHPINEFPTLLNGDRNCPKPITQN